MADIRAEAFWSPGPLFTEVRGTGVLRSSAQHRSYTERYPYVRGYAYA